MNEQQLLREPEIQPAANVLAAALGESYSIYIKFTEKLQELNIETEWRYYNDGKAWLGKNTHKKKTVFWLSIWDKFFQISLFFTEKTCGGVLELPTNDAFKKFEPSTGKLMPLVVKVRQNTNLDDLFKVIEYKCNLK